MAWDINDYYGYFPELEKGPGFNRFNSKRYAFFWADHIAPALDNYENYLLEDYRVEEERRLDEIYNSSPEDQAERSLLRDKILKAFDKLTPREELVLMMRYGFKGKPETLATIAGFLRVGPERIRQIEARALRKLRGPRGKKLRA